MTRQIVVILILWLVIFSTNAKQQMVGWDYQAGVTRYEIQAVRDGDNFATQWALTDGAATTFTVPKPKSGVFTIRVRACNATECSAWSSSAATGVPEPWKIFFKPSAPSFIVGPH